MPESFEELLNHRKILSTEKKQSTFLPFGIRTTALGSQGGLFHEYGHICRGGFALDQGTEGNRTEIEKR